MTITLTTALRYDLEGDDAVQAGFDKRDFVYDHTGNGVQAGTVVTVPFTSEADLDTSALPTVSCVYMENVDPSNFITYGPKSGGVMIPLGTLQPGQYAFIEVASGVTIRWQADTANVDVLVWIFD